MTSISALSANTYQSPLQKLEAELQSEVNSGAISSPDQSALSSTLTDIDSALQSSQASDSKGAPGDLKSKIDNLISSEVSSGKLTSDQASELKGVFKAAFANGPGGAGGPGGPPPPDGASSTDDASSTDGTSGSSSSSSTQDILKQLLTLLQSSQSSSASSYTATGNSGSQSSSASALLVDYKT
jgi:hypothetical protein